ncbi:cyclase family protein [Chloroflexota bacterium]
MVEDNDKNSRGASENKSEWIDISYPLGEGMIHWPMSPVYPHFDYVLHPSKGNIVTMSQININVHNGTHVDAPRHFVEDGTPIDEMPLDAIMGPARIIEIKDNVSIKPEELAPYDIQPGERILFKTSNSALYKKGKFVEDYVYISNEAGYFLRDKKVSVVGIDYQAIGSIKDMDGLIEVHKTLLCSGIWVIEVLDLSAVKAGRYELICLPIKLTQGDAGPARAIVRPL